MLKLFTALFASSACLLAVGFELRVSEEIVPPGGIAQVKVTLTDPSPISSGGTGIYFDPAAFGAIDGIAAFSAAGDVIGAAWVRGNRVDARFLSPQGDLGSSLDYPIMTIAVEVKSDAIVGYKTIVTLDPSASFWSDLLGQGYVQVIKPGSLTVGGSISIRNVLPGGGMLPAGSVVKIDGIGFGAGTTVQVDGATISSTKIVSPTEIDLTLGESADMYAKRIRVRNPDGSSDTYYSYLRASNLGTSSRTLLANTVPIFSTATLTTGAFTPTVFGPAPSTSFNGVALQNSSPAAANATIELLSASGASLGKSTVSLPSYMRYVRELSELFGGTLPPAGSSIRVSASSPLQMVALAGDDSTGIVQPIAVSATAPPAAAQLSVTPASLSFSYQVGGAQPVSQSLNVTSTAGPLNFTASPNAGWLTVTPSSASTPAMIAVGVNSAGMVPGTNNSSVSISSPAAPAKSIPVTLVVTSPPAPAVLNVAPASLTFSGQAGGAAPLPQSINATAAGPALSFSASASAGWLSINPASGSTPATLSVSVNPAGLAAGAYNGSVTLTPTGGPAVTVPVALTLTPAPSLSALNAAPVSLSFSGQAGGTAPVPQSLNVTATGAPLNFSASASAGWLSITPASGSTPATLSISVNPAGLAAGAYNGSITLTPTGGAAVTVPVALTLTSGSPLASLSVSPASLVFNFQSGGQPPAQQTVSVTSSSAPLNFTFTTSPAPGSWLIVSSPAGAAPTTLSVGINPTGLAAGTYNGSITVTPSGGTSGPQTVSIILTVGPGSAGPSLILSSTTMSFSFQTGGAPPAPQTIAVNSSSSPLNFMVSKSGGDWLSATPLAATTPAALTVAVNPAGLAPGTYSAQITVISPSAANSPQTCAITLTINSAPLLTVSPSSLQFVFQTGGANPPAQTVSVGSTGLSLNFTTAISPGANWLMVTPSAGATPATLSIQVNPGGLAPGAYAGSVIITSGSVSQTISVALTTGSAPVLRITPASLSFRQTIGDPAPPAQVITVASSSGSGMFSATADSSEPGWLSVSPASGSLPASVTVSVDGSTLAPGMHSGVITVASPGASNPTQTIPIVLTVNASPPFSVAPRALTYSYAGTGPPPPSQFLSLTSSGTTAVNFSATVSSASSVRWLTVAPAGGFTPATLTASANPAGLGPGTYTASIDIVASGSSTPVSVAATLTIASQNTPVIGTLVNGASQKSGAVAPGEIITIYGAFPAVETAGLRLDATGKVATVLSNARVLFDGIAAPLLYVSSTQINAVVPYEVAPSPSTHVEVEVAGVRSAASASSEFPVAPAAPGVFTLDASGQGAGAALNQDGTVNGISNAAPPGSIVSIYATGAGQTNPRGVTGSVTGNDLSNPVLPVSATMGGQSAPVRYAGSSPGLISGVLQVNIQIPDGIAAGAVPVVLTIGGASSQVNVMIVVQ